MCDLHSLSLKSKLRVEVQNVFTGCGAAVTAVASGGGGTDVAGGVAARAGAAVAGDLSACAVVAGA